MISECYKHEEQPKPRGIPKGGTVTHFGWILDLNVYVLKYVSVGKTGWGETNGTVGDSTFLVASARTLIASMIASSTLV